MTRSAAVKHAANALTVSSIRNFSVAVGSRDLYPADSNKFALITWDLEIPSLVPIGEGSISEPLPHPLGITAVML